MAFGAHAIEWAEAFQNTLKSCVEMLAPEFWVYRCCYLLLFRFVRHYLGVLLRCFLARI